MKYLFDGWKMIGVQDDSGQWWKVVVDCQRCGKCCEDRKGCRWNIHGRCEYLSYSNGVAYCNLGGDRPFSCSTNHPASMPSYCKMVLEPVDGNLLS